MYLRRVVLEDVKGFHAAEIVLGTRAGEYSGWWVLTGPNAAGKTALLKAISMALVGPDPIRTLQPNMAGWVRQGARKGTIAVEIVSGPRDKFVQGRRYERPFWAELLLLDEGQSSGPIFRPGVKYRRKEKGPTHGPWSHDPSGWFCAGYGPFRRLYGASPEAQRVMSGSGRVARFATLFREDATLSESEYWLRELHFRALENSEKEIQLLQQVTSFLNSDFLKHDISIHKIDSDGVWLKQVDGVILPLRDMSEGFRAALAMVLDIVRNLVDVFGVDDLVTEKSGELIIKHTGVVLIDEIDAHLHPEWQREIGFWLTKRMPNIQFVVSTHSPLVCAAASEEGVYYLSPPGSAQQIAQITKEEYLDMIRSTSDGILRGPAFRLPHTRSPRAVAAKLRLATLNAKKASARLTADEQREIQLLLPLWGVVD